MCSVVDWGIRVRGYRQSRSEDIYAAASSSQMRLGLAYWFTGHERIFIDDVGSTSAKARSTDVVSIQTKAGMVFVNDQF